MSLCKSDHARKREVELLFDGKRPSYSPKAICVPSGHGEVLQKQRIEPPASDLLQRIEPPASDLVHSAPIHQRESCCENYQVDRNDPKEPSLVKATKIIGPITRIEQDSPDQEAGKNKEQIYAAPSKATGDL